MHGRRWRRNAPPARARSTRSSSAASGAGGSEADDGDVRPDSWGRRRSTVPGTWRVRSCFDTGGRPGPRDRTPGARSDSRRHVRTSRGTARPRVTTAVLHGFVHHLDHRAVEPADVLRREGVTHAVVAQTSGVQDLVAVDVADARDQMLIHQERLELHRLRDQHPAEVDPRDRLVERIETQSRELRCVLGEVLGIAHEHLAERARVDETQLSPWAAA